MKTNAKFRNEDYTNRFDLTLQKINFKTLQKKKKTSRDFKLKDLIDNWKELIKIEHCNKKLQIRKETYKRKFY